MQNLNKQNPSFKFHSPPSHPPTTEKEIKKEREGTENNFPSMAPHPRMLFPFPSNSTDCLTSCSSACLFYNLCTTPSSSPPPAPPSAPIHLRHFLHLPLFLLVPSCFLILLSFFCLFLIFLRRCRTRNSNAEATPAVLLPSLPILTTNVNDHSDQHYVWFIRTVGLDDSAIQTISAWSYKEGDGVGEGMAGCAVCLGEFHDGELLRLLPKCGHAFHVPCIDTWLRAHANCPLCRAPVMAPGNLTPPSPSDQPDDSSDGGDSSSTEGNEGVGGVRDRTSSSSRVQCVRRSASMGSLPVDCKEGNSEEGSGSKSREEKSSSDLETVELERSRSCTCNGLFLSR